MASIMMWTLGTRLSSDFATPAAKDFRKNKNGSSVEKMTEKTIPLGGAGLIVAYPPIGSHRVKSAVTRTIQEVVGEA
jgi:hypothetical protein